MTRLTGPGGGGLTPVQQTIIDFLAGHFRQHGRSPSLREIGLASGLKSSSAVSYQVKVLQAKGCLTYAPGIPRSITLTGPYQPQRPAFAGYGDLIALRVRGDSMTGTGIWDGALVIVRRPEQVEPGELAAALPESPGGG